MANFAMGRLSEAVKCFAIVTVITCALSAQTMHSPSPPAYGLQGKPSDWTTGFPAVPSLS